MKEEKSYKKLIGSCILVLCMAIAMISVVAYAEESNESQSIIYEPGYEYSAEKYTDETGIKTAPVKQGYLFAGWFTLETENSYTSVSEPKNGETYYAKFVPADVLNVKAQVSDTLFDDTTENDSTAAIRFITSIDHSLDYQEVGFKIKKGSTGTATDAEVSKSVYRTIYVVDANDASGEPSGLIPEAEFHPTSYYFKTWTIKNIQEAAFNTDITVTPYWITVDGTRVEGTTSIKTVNLGRSWIYVDATANEDKEQYGTRKHPYTTLAAAINVDTEIDKTVILKSDMNMDTTVTIDENVTLTSENRATVTRTAEQTGDMFSVTAGTFTIQGSEGKEVVIDGNIDTTADDATAVDARAINVAKGATFNMTNGVIQNFYTSSDKVGALYSEGSFDITNSKFSDNISIGYSGAIYASGTTAFTITGGEFTNNKGSRGGAIFSTSAKSDAIQMTDCTFEENTASQHGGAVYVGNKNTLKVKNSSFRNNTATTGYGGAITLGTDSSTIEFEKEVTFANNTAEGTSHGGGAVMTGSGLTIKKDADVTFKNNKAESSLGGAVYFNTDSENVPEFKLEAGATLVMTDNADRNDTTDIAVEQGMPVNIELDGSYKINKIYAEVETLIMLGENAEKLDSGNLTMVQLTGTVADEMQLVTGSSVVAESTAENTIFAVSATEPVTLYESGYLGQLGMAARIDNTYYEGLAEALEAAVEGDEIVLKADIEIENVIEITKGVTITTDNTNRTISFVSSLADYPITVKADGKTVAFEGSATDAKLIFKGTGETAFAKSILCLNEAEKVTMEYVNMQNANGSNSGGAIDSYVPLELKNCNFTNCKVTGSSKYGGAIIMRSAALTAVNCTFSGCEAKNSGGAIYGNGGGACTVTLTGCTFTDNTISAGGGGAIYIADKNTMTIDGCTFTGNSAISYGGAVGMGTDSSTLDFKGECLFKGNTVVGNKTHFGGAVFAPSTLRFNSGATVTMTDNTCTGFDYGDAISINVPSNKTYTFTIYKDAQLIIDGNSDAENFGNSICYEDTQSTKNGTGTPITPTYSEEEFDVEASVN